MEKYYKNPVENVEKRPCPLLHLTNRGGEPYKEVFNLSVFAELPFKEIGGLFGKSDGCVHGLYEQDLSAVFG